MMRLVFALLVALFPLILPAQTALWIDLTGEWRTIEGDDPRYASAGFDDSTWRTIRLPQAVRSRLAWVRNGWLRRTVILPEAPQVAAPLAFTTGSIPGTWELYVNGQLAGSTGPNLIVGRPTTIQLPPGQKPGGRLVLAFRIRDSDRAPGAWRITDSGPWVLTSASVAPRDLERTTLGMQKLLRLGELVEPLILVCLAVVVLLIWISQRSERKLFWLGAYLLAVAGGRLNLFWQIGPDPLWFPELSVWLLSQTLPAAVLAHFVSAWTGIRWFLWPVWILAALGVTPPLQGPGSFGIWGIIALTLTALAEHMWRTRRDYLLSASVVVVVYLHAGSWTNLRDTIFPVLIQTNFGNWIPFALVWHMLAVTVFGFAITLVLVRRLVRDRDEKVRLAGELEAARTVQQLLLPSVSAGTESFVSDAVYQPAQEVGGDFYWTRVEPGGALLVVVGDVSGKGLKAAMLVSVVVGILRNEKSASPAAILEALNNGLTGHTGGGFVTCCCARFDASGAVTIANAGHPSPYCDGREVAVEAGLPLGVVAGVAYEESVVRGDRFTFVSDGVVEAENAQRELFGFDRTREISTKSAQEIAEAAKVWGQNDDITVVTVRRNS